MYNNLICSEIDIIALAEIWLTDGILNSQPTNSKYKIYCKDRYDGRLGGDVLFAVHENWTSVDLTNYNVDHEYLLLKVFNSYVSFFVCCLYLPPQSPMQRYSSYLQIIDNNPEVINSNLIIIGDFNLNIITGEHTFSESFTVYKTFELGQFMNFYQLQSFDDVQNFQVNHHIVLTNHVNVEVVQVIEKKRLGKKSSGKKSPGIKAQK